MTQKLSSNDLKCVLKCSECLQNNFETWVDLQNDSNIIQNELKLGQNYKKSLILLKNFAKTTEIVLNDCKLGAF